MGDKVQRRMKRGTRCRLCALTVALVAIAAPGSAAAAEGDLTWLQSFTDGADGVDGLLGANAVTVSQDGENLYVAGRFDNSVAVFSRNPVSGVLTFQEVEKDGVAGVNGLAGARRVIVSPDGQDVYVTGSEDDAIVVFDRSQVDGTLAFNEVELDSTDAVARGLDRALGMAATTDGKFVYVAAENDSAINIFSRNLATGTLDFIGKVTSADAGVTGLTGAVGVGLSPDADQEHLYATSYAGDSLTAWSRNPTTGALTFIEAKTDAVGGIDGLNGADGPEISADGAFMYASGDIDDAIAAFGRDPATGQVTQVDLERDGVNGVDGLNGVTLFAISPDQKHVYAPGEFDDALAWFNRDPVTGALAFRQALFDSDPVIDGLDGAEGVAVSPDGNNVYVGSNVNELAVFGRVPDTTPPDTAIGTGPDPQTSDSTPSFAFSSAESFLERFECRIDAAAFGACSGATDHTASPLADGAHTFAVRAVDTAGNPDPAPATRAFTVDTVNPDTQITSGPTGTTNDATPTFGFSGSDLALAGFECQLDGGPFVGCSGAGEHTAAALNDGVHSFSVRARDGAGNIDGSPATRLFSVDATAPETEITSGPTGTTNDATPTFGFSGSDLALAGFECELDGAAFATCSGASEHTAAVLSDGVHSFSVRARDGAGNVDASPATRSFFVDATAPETQITSGPTGTTNDATPTFGFSGSDLALAGFECQLDGAAFATCSGAGEHTAPPLTDGVHSFSVRARDDAGNVDGSPATRPFSVDATAPDTQITRRPKNRVFTNERKVRVRFIWIADEPGGTFACALDRQELEPCGKKKAKFKVKAKGGKGRKHLFRVQAIDAGGNRDPSPAIDRFRAILR